MASDTGAPLTFPHCKQRSRLFEAIEPPTIKRPRKGKTSIRKFVFSGNLRSHEGATVRETRIITELGMPVQDAFDALLIMNLGRFPSWIVLCGALILVLTFSLTGVMDVVLQLRNPGS